MADTLAALRQWGVEATINGNGYIIPPMPAVDWIEAVLTDDVLGLFPDEAQDDIDELYERDSVAVEQLVVDAIEAAAGRPWHIAARLTGLLVDDANRGEMLSRVDITVLPFAAALDAFYAMVVKWKEKDKRDAFERKLNAPPDLPFGQRSAEDSRTAAQRMRELSRARAEAIGKQSGDSPPSTQPQFPPRRPSGTPKRPKRRR